MRIVLSVLAAMALGSSSVAVAQSKGGYKPYSVPTIKAPTYQAPRYTAPMPSYGSNPSSTFVAPSIRRDGTFVPGHARSSPNSTQLDNWSTKGNYNPYSGKAGTRNAYR